MSHCESLKAEDMKQLGRRVLGPRADMAGNDGWRVRVACPCVRVSAAEDVASRHFIS